MLLHGPEPGGFACESGSPEPGLGSPNLDSLKDDLPCADSESPPPPRCLTLCINQTGAQDNCVCNLGTCSRWNEPSPAMEANFGEEPGCWCLVIVMKVCNIFSSCSCDGFSALLSRRGVMFLIKKKKKGLVLPPFFVFFPYFFFPGQMF